MKTYKFTDIIKILLIDSKHTTAIPLDDEDYYETVKLIVDNCFSVKTLKKIKKYVDRTVELE